MSFELLPTDVLKLIPMESDVRSRMRGVNRDLRSRLDDIDWRFRSNRRYVDAELRVKQLFYVACENSDVQLAEYYLCQLGTLNLGKFEWYRPGFKHTVMSLPILRMLQRMSAR